MAIEVTEQNRPYIYALVMVAALPAAATRDQQQILLDAVSELLSARALLRRVVEDARGGFSLSVETIDDICALLAKGDGHV